MSNRIAAPGVIETSRALEIREIVQALIERHNKIVTPLRLQGFNVAMLALVEAE